MSDKDKKSGKPTLSLRRTTAETGRVRQNIAHGRSKTVVVETKRKRIITPRPRLRRRRRSGRPRSLRRRKRK